MNMKRRVLRAGAVLAVAIAAGHLVQTMSAEREAALAEAASSAAMPENLEPVSAGPEAAAPIAPTPLPVGASLTPAVPVTPVKPEVRPEPVAPDVGPEAALTLPEPPLAEAEVELAALGDPAPIAPPAPALPSLPDLSPPAPAAVVPDCTPHLTLTARPGAMIALTLDAPCAAGERVVLRHAGLAVAETLDAEGRLTLDLPALDTRGAVSILMQDGAALDRTVAVPQAAITRRFAVQWMADDAFQLRAVEQGQVYGDAGNVSVEAPASARGGSLVSLGDPSLDLPMLAQVYTWPADPLVSARPVIEAAVTEATCDRDLLGETILSTLGRATVSDLTLTMPGCDALGDILVLNIPPQDVTVTAGN